MNVYIHLNGEEFEKRKTDANKKSREDDSKSKDYNFNEMPLEKDEILFENGKIYLSGNNDLGYFSIESKLDLDVVVQIIEFYMKKLGKLKTVLEATK